MISKRKMELLAKAARIKELEEILCPCEQQQVNFGDIMEFVPEGKE